MFPGSFNPPTLAHLAIEVLRASCAAIDGLGVVVSRLQLIADLADGYDVVIIGADKWHQIHDVQFYGGSLAHRDSAIARLPAVAIAPRPPLEIRSMVRSGSV